MANKEARHLLPSAAPPPAHPNGRGGAGIVRSARRSRRATSLRHDIWTVLRFRSSVKHGSGLQLASYVLELCILMLVLLNVVLAISESSSLVAPGATPHVSTKPSEWYQTFLFVSTLIFSVEYALRFWSCVEDERYNSPVLGRLKWMTRPMSVIDLLALVPFYLEITFEYMFISYPGALTLRSLRLLRILSFLRLERSYSAMTNLRFIFGNKKEELLVVTYLTGVLVLTSSTTIFFLENAAQPTVFYSVGVSAWWSVETITSLGYGDMVPQTTAGKLFGAVLALWGIILFTIPGAILGSAFIELMLERQRQEEDDAVSVIMSNNHWEQSGAANAFASSMSGRRASEADADKYNETSPVSQSGAQSFRRLSPRVATILRVDSLSQKVDDVLTAQMHIQEQLAEQRTQIFELRRLVEVLVARTEPSGAES